ncbi:hypothetical protein [Roseinatronobacter alkalisoli]|uniref:Lipoprotein n=1 Tax=Roseinatronobacter alkalisoli TaxID=3028235 RepID=A0ABT5T993_9RHOB|nr:hypothetical protein [Roseinatronobacter sp. HJB301]MDD7970742.1 hypothetical protein [Roseinatronobacter sp. HJB301]
MFRLLFSLVLFLTACDSPSPWLAHGTATPVTAAGYNMTIWQAGDNVEVIRHGYAPRRDQPRLRPAMARAIVDVTGCEIRPDTLEGDSGVLRAKLDCG